MATFYQRSPKLCCKDTKGIPSCWNSVSLNPLPKSAWGILPTCLGTVCAAKRKPGRLEHCLFQESTMDSDCENFVCTSSYCTWMGATPHSNSVCQLVWRDESGFVTEHNFCCRRFVFVQLLQNVVQNVKWTLSYAVIMVQQLVFIPSKSETFCVLSVLACLIARHVLLSVFLDLIPRLLEYCALSLSDFLYWGFPLTNESDCWCLCSWFLTNSMKYPLHCNYRFWSPFSTAAVFAPLVARFRSSVSTSSYYLTENISWALLH